MIILDPGHGGADPGGGTNDLWKEKDLALKISNYQFNRFNELGIPVQMTRYSDKTLTPSERISIANSITNRDPNTILISNHINNNFGVSDGAEVIYSIYESSELPDLIATELIKAGQNIRNVYTRINKNGQDYYFIIRETRPMQSMIVEYGFADSPGDDINQLLFNWEELAEAVVQAVLIYKGLATSDVVFYKVEPGDTLFKIADSFNTTVEEIVKLNNLPSTSIKVGQLLEIPGDNNNFTTYTVVAGDNLYQIAKKFNTTVDEIKRLNNLSSNLLSIGQVLKIPSNNQVTPKPSPTTEIIYTVRPGDTLSEIALKYGTTVSSIKQLNNLVSDTIFANQTLKIIPTTKIYTVKPGDNLYKIARMFNTTVEKIKLDNNLSSNTIYVGQELLIA